MAEEQKIILVVDDDESIVRGLSIRLRSAGYKVFAALDGTQAVMMTHSRKPDLLILDLRMPAGDGFSVMEKLHHSFKTMNIPIIILSATDSEENIERAKEMGAYRFFKKPADLDELLKSIEEALEQ